MFTTVAVSSLLPQTAQTPTDDGAWIPQSFYTPPKNFDASAPIRGEIISRLKSLVEPGDEAQHKNNEQPLNVIFPVGGTSGVIPAGMASALLQYSAWQQRANDLQSTVPGSRIFNKIIAGSAGAFTAPYFASGQQEGLAIYYHFLPKPEFLSFKRFPFMNLDYVFKTMKDDVPLHVEKGLAPDAPKLEVRATEMPGLTPVKLTDFGDAETLFQALRASAKQPTNGLSPVVIGGKKLIDAGFSDPFCLEGPYRDTSNARYVLFSNLPQNATEPKNLILYVLDIMPNYPSRSDLLDAVHRAWRLRKEMEKAGRLLVVYPQQIIPATETNPIKLENGAQDGMRSFCRRILGQDNVPIRRTMGKLPEGNHENPVPMFKLKFS